MLSARLLSIEFFEAMCVLNRAAEDPIRQRRIADLLVPAPNPSPWVLPKTVDKSVQTGRIDCSRSQGCSTIGKIIADGLSAVWKIVFFATRVLLESGPSPVFKLRSNCGKLLDVMSTRI